MVQGGNVKIYSKYPGVSFYPEHKYWVARLIIKDTMVLRKYFKTEREAYESYRKVKIEYLKKQIRELEAM